MANFVVIGLMSGTSLDGLDIVAVSFEKQKLENFDILKSTTISYPKNLSEKLNTAINLSGFNLAKLNSELGKWFGEQTQKFCSDLKISPNLISSHGHTIFHQPQMQFGLQIGMPWQIEKYTNCPVVADFRTADIVRGGQGAPLVPGGEFELFPNADVFVNLGGFSNISFKNQDGHIIAFDISPCNILMNALANEMNLSFDKNGENAKSGSVIPTILSAANDLEYYFKNPPKSLGREWFEANYESLFMKGDFNSNDKLRTAAEHIVDQIEKVTTSHSLVGKTFMWTGGGAHNKFLMNLIHERIAGNHLKVSDEIINFKEALIFAYLGLKRVLNQKNILSTVTGATSDSIGGALYGDFSKI